jgi:hypothetical protein
MPLDANSTSVDVPPAIKDINAAHSIAGAWRPMLRDVVNRLVNGDYRLEIGISGVEPVSAKTAEHIRASVANYGATLIDLPDDTWQTSVAQWYGTHWDVMVDLWTAEEGPSDLILQGRIVESQAGHRLSVHMVYVP